LRIEEGSQLIKDQMDKQVEKRKEALDLIRDYMFKEVDEHAEKIKK
jgi:hypothetical protein